MTPPFSLGPRTPETVLELSIYNLLGHVKKVDMNVHQITKHLCENWHTRGPRTPEPTDENVREAAARLADKGHVTIGNDSVVRVTMRQPNRRGMPLFVEKAKTRAH